MTSDPSWNRPGTLNRRSGPALGAELREGLMCSISAGESFMKGEVARFTVIFRLCIRSCPSSRQHALFKNPSRLLQPPL